MDCRQLTELLPWWINGTLEDGQSAEVEQHLATCSACAEQLRQTRVAADLLDGHVPVEALVAHAVGDPVPAAQRQAVASHLQVCEQCRSELALVAENHQRLGNENERETGAVSAGKTVSPWPDRSWRWATMAASVAAVVICCLWIRTMAQHDRERVRWARQQHELETQLAGSTTREVSLQQELAAKRQRPVASGTPTPADDEAARLRSLLSQHELPRLNTLVLRLIPSSTATVMRGDGEPENEISVEQGADGTAQDRVTLILLTTTGENSFRACQVELLDASGAVVWNGSGLHASPDGEFTLSLPVTLLPRPAFALRVSCGQDGERREVGHYRVTVRDS